ncbi:hypothetical protein GQ44DRAFT_779536 [Phaeosphaeriaceae sp. PMI808]|nr:hypothetical protein GQ44DRAFT_779536 [Phaeosphaeriaceae sp. PMI808]
MIITAEVIVDQSASIKEDENTTIRAPNETIYTGKVGVRKVLERMGAEGLTQGIDNPIFAMIVDVHPNWKEAVGRGGTWKVQDVEITPPIVADYYKGWGYGGLSPWNKHMPPFVNTTEGLVSVDKSPQGNTNVTKESLERRLQRSSAYDSAENQSHAYGYFLDDLQAVEMGAPFAKKGHKSSPFAGFFQTPNRITQVNIASYGSNRSALRSNISFHWRPQPVILVSQDGRSATFQFGDIPRPSRVGGQEMVTLERYDRRVLLRVIVMARGLGYCETTKYITLVGVGERQSTFRGGSGRFVEWPEIQRMWPQYCNPVSGRKPRWYWPGCVPFVARTDWSLDIRSQLQDHSTCHDP